MRGGGCICENGIAVVLLQNQMGMLLRGDGKYCLSFKRYGESVPEIGVVNAYKKVFLDQKEF